MPYGGSVPDATRVLPRS